MKNPVSPFAQQARSFLVQVFFSLVKAAVLLIVLGAGVLIAAQSSVAPVSVRLLTSYGIEYAAATLKPYRHLFPEPYPVKIENNEN